MPEAKPLSSSFSRAALDLLFPSKCALCDLLGDDPICGACLSDFQPNPQPVRQAVDGGPLSLIVSPFVYEGRAGQAVRRLKYSRATSLVAPLSAMVAEAFAAHGLAADAIIPIPIHWTRRCWRGFNQAELLAEALPAELVHAAWLRRVRATPPQAGLTREQRLRNLVGAFQASSEVVGMSILLIDDVVTSGRTASECAAELRRAGAADVRLLTLAGD